MNFEIIVDRCTQECIRQEVGLVELARLLKAYEYALSKSMFPPSIYDISALAITIEPFKAARYRVTPVTFPDASTAIDAQNIVQVLTRMWSNYDWANSEDLDDLVKGFLDIHPFEDGNGRTAFVLYNWLNKSLENPVPLPDYYGEN